MNWRVPAGKWVILRLGYTPTGVNNHPAPAEGTGLECDKFSKAALDAHWAGFMQKVLDDIGPLAGKTLDSSLIDSYEVGGQNWTANFRAEFQKRRGYDPLKFLPAFTGRVVDSPAVSERFLWDMRRTIADLFAENYYGHFAELCRQHGLMSTVEPYTGPFESLQCGAPADVGDGRILERQPGESFRQARRVHRAHLRQNHRRRGVVHRESRRRALAERSVFAQDARRPDVLPGIEPLHLPPLRDAAVDEPLAGHDDGPVGLSFRAHGDVVGRRAKPWIDYITHCQFLLQQGRAVADAAYFTGESAPVEMRVGNPALPAGYDYDAVNADVLLHGATVKNGRLTLASGANYAVLILPPDDVNMTPQMLKCIREIGARRRDRRRPAPATFAEPRRLSEMRCAGEKTRRRTVGQMRRQPASWKIPSARAASSGANLCPTFSRSKT